MSVGPTALSSLLVQRLDAVLGTQLAQQGNQNAARMDAVTPAGNIDGVRPDPQGRDADLPGNLSGRERAALREAAEQAELAAALRSRFVSSDATRSAPTTLGQTARVILTLLAQYPETAPALAGKAPLWTGNANADRTADGATGSAAKPGSAGANPAPAGQAAGNTAETREIARPGGAQTTVGAQAADAARAAALNPRAPQPGPLAQALRLAIETSGLFYESHLSDAAYGQRSVAQLRGEPQAGLDASQAPPIHTPVPKQSILADNPHFNLPTHAAPMMSQADGLPSSGSAPTWSASTPGHAPAAPPGIHPEAALLVRQQLEVLANQTLAWEGTAWPGADMWWEIRREPRETDTAAAEAPAAWATRLVLTMPRLGTVEARISLSGQRLGLQIVAPTSDHEIADAGNDLRKQMQTAGLELAQLTVSAHAPAPEAMP